MSKYSIPIDLTATKTKQSERKANGGFSDLMATEGGGQTEMSIWETRGKEPLKHH